MEVKRAPLGWKLNITLGGVSNTEIMLFTRHLAVCLRSGLTLFEALEMLRDQAAGALRGILENVVKDLQSGQPLHQALSVYPKYFSAIYINLIRVGEISGTLEGNLQYLSESLKKSYDLRQKVKSAMMYPIVVFVAVILLGLSVGMFVLPKILPLFKSLNVALSLPTRALMYAAELFEVAGVQIIVSTVLFLIFFFWFVRRDFVKPVLHRIFLIIPFLKDVVVNINLALFSRTLGMLLENGISLDQSLKITVESTDNHVYKRAASGFLYQIQNGKNLSEILDQYPRLFPLMACRMIAMGERTGNLGNSLTYLAEYYESEVDNTLKDISVILEPALLIFIGSIVGTVAIAIIGPIYSITSSLGHK